MTDPGAGAPIGRETLAEIVADHELWRRTEGREGRRARLDGARLDGVDLHGVSLRGATMRQAELHRVDLRGADLSHTDLTGTTFNEVDLRDARLAHTHLDMADLTNVRCLVEGQLGGADLSFARLPEGFEFTTQEQAEEAAKGVQVQALLLLFASLYSWLTLGSTTHLDLVTNASSTFVPLLELALPIIGFYFVAPLLLFALYVAFWLQMGSFWDRLSGLPAVFPDGLRLTQRNYPTVLDGLVERRMPRLRDPRDRRSVTSRLKQGMAYLVANALVPVTLWLYWWTYLPRHEPLGTALHVVLIFAAGLLASLFWRSVSRHFGDDLRHRPPSLRRSHVLGWGAVAMALVVLSGWVFYGSRLPVEAFYVDLAQQQVSRPSGDDVEEVEAFRGAELAGKNLRYANLEHAVLAGADLQRARLDDANLGFADLRGVVAIEASLPASDLHRARLERADFRRARMPRARLHSADLRQAVFAQADLSGASLDAAHLEGSSWSRADLRQARLHGVEAQGADLSLADLSGAYLARASLPEAVLFLTRLREARLWRADLRGANLVLADLSGANLSLANLEGADLSQANLAGASLGGANLRNTRWIYTRLEEAVLVGADLTGANLSGAQLRDADLRRARVDDALLDDAWVEGADFTEVDLAHVRGLTDEQRALMVVDRRGPS